MRKHLDKRVCGWLWPERIGKKESKSKRFSESADKQPGRFRQAERIMEARVSGYQGKWKRFEPPCGRWWHVWSPRPRPPASPPPAGFSCSPESCRERRGREEGKEDKRKREWEGSREENTIQSYVTCFPSVAISSSVTLTLANSSSVALVEKNWTWYLSKWKAAISALCLSKSEK